MPWKAENRIQFPIFKLWLLKKLVVLALCMGDIFPEKFRLLEKKTLCPLKYQHSPLTVPKNHKKPPVTLRYNWRFQSIKSVSRMVTYSKVAPAFAHASLLSSSHRDTCTSPMCALPNNCIEIRD